MTVQPLRSPPDPHAPECALGCVGAIQWGACQQFCARTAEFQAYSSYAAKARQTRFRTEIGANRLRLVDHTAQLRNVWAEMAELHAREVECWRMFGMHVEQLQDETIVRVA